MKCPPDAHEFMVVDEFTTRDEAYIVCARCGEYRVARIVPETPIPPAFMDGMASHDD